MAVQFIFGGSGRGKTYFLQHKIMEEAVKNPKKDYIMIVPEQFTMQTQKDMIRISPGHGIMNVDVQSFVRLAFRVFSETGAGNIQVLDDLGKIMILKKVLSNKKDDLKYFGRNINKDGYISEIKSFMSELIQYGVDENEIEKMIQASENKTVLKYKLQDMSVAFSAFKEYIDKNYITSEELLSVFADVISQSGLLKGAVICLDGFTGFTPLQYRLLRELIKIAEKVYITVTADERESVINKGKNYQLLFMSRKTVNNIRLIASETGVEVLDDIWTGKEISQTRFGSSKELEWLERNLFRYPYKRYNNGKECEVSDISCHVLKYAEDEIDFVVQKIKRLLVNEGCRYRDIAIVAGSLETYGNIIEHAMKKAGIACFIDQKRGVQSSVLVRAIDALLQIIIKDFSYEDIMDYLKGCLSWTSDSQNDILDNYLLATGIRGFKAWNREWNTSYAYRRMTDESKEFANGIVENVRLSVIENLSEFYEKVAKGKHTVRDYATALVEFFERQHFYEKLMEFADDYEENENFDVASEYRQLYDMVIEVLEKLVSIMGDEEMLLKEFKDILDVGFSEARIGVIPPGIDQVMAGDLSRTRISNIKYMFLVGANSSNIPKGSGSGGIISESERNFLAENEFELAPTARQQVYTEQFYLYLNLTKPSKHLYITYCDSERDGSVNEPSYIISRINKIFPTINVKFEERKKNEENAWSDDDGKKYLIAGLRNGDFSDKKWQEIYNRYFKSEDDKSTLNKILKAAFFKENKSSISKKVAKSLYPENLRGSTSQLERYAACAFSYFMQYGLKLQERQEHNIEAYDIGNIVHDTLDMYTKILLANNMKWQDVDKKEQERIAGECVEKAVSLCKDGIMRDTSRNQYMIKRIHNVVNKTIWAISKQMSQGSFDTIDSELIFETVGKSDKTDEELIKLVGKIDRLDGFTDGSKDYVRVIDYKTGNKELSLSELYYGLQMQLVIYLKASVDKAAKTKKIVVPAGMLYYRIKDPILNERVTTENVEQKTLESLAMNGLVNGDSPMLEGSDKSLESNDGVYQPDYISSVSNIETGKKGQIKKSSGITNTDCLNELIDFTEKKVVDMSEEILDGNTSVNPYKTMDSQPKSACMYCAFKSVCRFDSRLYGNDYRVFEKLSDDDVMRLIHSELSESDK